MRGPLALDTIRVLPMPRKVKTSAREAGEQGEVALSFSASLQFVRPVRHFLESLCVLANYPEEECQAIALVTTEILNNSIEHGAAGPADEIHLVLRVRPDSFRCEVRDPGRGGRAFANRALEIAQRMPSLEEARGRGLFLIRKNMDNLEVTYDPATGTRVVVTKARNQ
ncbi:MAG: ATP-binding protein [Planctomycetaceae bacterium]